MTQLLPRLAHYTALVILLVTTLQENVYVRHKPRRVDSTSRIRCLVQRASRTQIDLIYLLGRRV